MKGIKNNKQNAFEDIFLNQEVEKKEKKRKRKLLFVIVVTLISCYLLVSISNLLNSNYGTLSKILDEQCSKIIEIIHSNDDVENQIVAVFEKENMLINYVEIKKCPEDEKHSNKELLELEDSEYRYSLEDDGVEIGQVITVDETPLFIEFGIKETAYYKTNQLYNKILDKIKLFLIVLCGIKVISLFIREKNRVKGFALINTIIVGGIFAYLRMRNFI